MALRRVRDWLAGGARPREDAILVLGENAGAFDAAGPIIDALMEGRFRLSVVLVTGRDGASLAGRFPGAEIRRPPLTMRPLSGLTLTALRARAALVLAPDELRGMPRRLADGAVRRGIPVFGTSAGRLLPLSHVAGLVPGEGADIAAALARAIGVAREPVWSLDRFGGWIARSPLRFLLKPVLTRIGSAEALALRLGHPKTILCLGNGPTSTDQVLAGLGAEAIFRVNHDWRSNGYLARPDMVFAGVKRSMRKLGGTPLGVATRQKEGALVACRAFEPWHGRATYAVVEDIAARIVPGVPGPVRPTTGAYMLAAAIALRPERLIVAGMDMFRHPDGAYAAGSDVNAYTPAHGFDVDASFITACLIGFEGELVVYSPALADLARQIPGIRLVTPGEG